MKNFAAFFAFFLVFISSVNAHFKLEAPPFRGDDEETMIESPCGGFNEVNIKAISEFPVTSEYS